MSAYLQIAVVAVYCVLLFVVMARARKNFLALPELKPAPSGGPTPDCMVVIPARNEEGSIGRAVGSLPADSVIVVDDFSTDKTAEEAQAAGAGVLKASPLPRGAVGKPHACAEGARLLTSRWILFADADTWYEPGFLDAAVAVAEASGLDLLSIQLRYRPKDLIGYVLTPYAEALYFAGVQPEIDPVAAFNAQCMLVRRQPYEFFSGHSSVMNSPVDDVRLARLADRHRMVKAVVRTRKLGFARLHSGWREFRHGIRRNAFRTTQLDAKIGVTILATALFAALWLPAVGWLIWTGEFAAAAAVFLLWPVLMLPWYRQWVWMAPFAVYLMLPIVIGAAISVMLHRKIHWKGRVIN